MKILIYAHFKEENSTYFKKNQNFQFIPQLLSSAVLTLTTDTAAWQRWVVQPGCHGE